MKFKSFRRSRSYSKGRSRGRSFSRGRSRGRSRSYSKGILVSRGGIRL